MTKKVFWRSAKKVAKKFVSSGEDEEEMRRKVAKKIVSSGQDEESCKKVGEKVTKKVRFVW